MRKILIRLGGLLLLLFLGLVGGGYLYLQSSLPTINGAISLDGPEAEIEIRRDHNGVPHIYAQSDHDLYFAVGFVHAQDRLWQMEINRRIAQGRLAEVVGAGALETDKFLRTLGVYEAAKSAYVALDAPAREMLEAYTAGVNAFLATREGALPVEFLLLGHEPQAWQPADSVAWLKMMAWDLSKNWRKEIGRLTLLSRLDPEQVMEFYPPYRGDAPTPLPDPQALYGGLEWSGKAVAFVGQADPAVGSNNWVVSGAHTVTGKPLLANDPHLGLKSPSVWYLVHLSMEGRNLVGVTLPGLPFIVLGRNDFSAWGFTNTGPDTQDLYLEKITGDGQYATPDGPASFRLRREIIRVKDAEPIELEVRETRHGPVISDVMASLDGLLPEGHVLAFRWTALDPTDRTTEAARNWMRSASWDQFVSGLEGFHTPQQNIVYGDIEGNIGYYAPANVPIRAPENMAKGQLPVPGWLAAYDWQGYLPKAVLPRLYNPERGYIATANAKIHGHDYAYHLTREWAFPYRTTRINSLLENGGKHSVESFMKLQLDNFSVMADEFVPLLAPHVAASHPDIAQALSDWDRHMARERPEPLVYIAWHRALARRIYADELGDLFPLFWQLKPEFLYRVLNNTDGTGRWCDDVSTEALEDCAAMIQLALVDAMSELEETLGHDWRRWRWGDVHQAHHIHRPFSEVAFLRPWFEIVRRVDGGPYTINVSNVRTNQPQPFETRNGPSFRAIYDLSDLNNSRFVIPTGQSGNPVSPYYDQLTDLWAEGRYIRIPTKIDEVRAITQARLVLKPAAHR